MNFAGLFHLLIFTRLLFAIPAGWFFVWCEHKAVARMQRRIGPPLLQPFWDFIKLLGKRTPARHGIEADLLRLYPVLSVFSLIAALALLPVFPTGSKGFSGDVVLLVALLELPSICFILAGFTSGSIYGEIGAIREAVLGVANNVVFLLAIVTIAVTEGTFRMADLAGPSKNPGPWIGVIGILLCIPAKLRLNPFSTSSAEQEIYSGPLTEYAGAALALWDLAHGLEWVALTGRPCDDADIANRRPGVGTRNFLRGGFTPPGVAALSRRCRHGAFHVATLHKLVLAMGGGPGHPLHLLRYLHGVPAMNIFRLIFDNLRHGTVSFPLPHEHQCTSNRYRGLIENDAERCVGCGSCAYVCPTAAIEVSRSGDTYQWTYDPGKCTFCGRCIDRCRPNTLTMESKLPPLYPAQGDLKQVLRMIKKKPVRAAAHATSTAAESTGIIAAAVPAPVQSVAQAE